MSEQMSLPQTWTLTPLSQISRIVTGRTPPTANRVLYGSDIPFVSPSDLGSEKWITRAEKMLSFEGWSAVNQLPANSILFSCIGYIGKIGIAAVELATNQQINAVIPSRQADFEFLYYALSHSSAKLRSQASEQVLPIVNKSTFSKFCVPLPPLPEQQAIAAALSDADGVVAGLERVIAKKRLIKQGAMQDLLTARRRLPGFSGEWEPVNLARESHLKARIGWQGLTTNEYRDSGEYHLITGTEIIDGRVDWRRCVFVDKWRYDQDRNIQLRNGDVLLTKDGTIGKVAQVRDLPGPAALNSGVFVIRPKSEAYDATFLFHVLRSSVFDTFLAKLTAGSTIVHLYQKDLVTFEFLAPDIAEQKAIAEALDDMDAEIQTLESRLAKARAVKEGMMQNLLTGRVRLV